jgi:hypothetical protein
MCLVLSKIKLSKKKNRACESEKKRKQNYRTSYFILKHTCFLAKPRPPSRFVHRVAHGASQI